MYQRKDYYYQKAKQQGYRARASFKLLQINKKYNLIKKTDAILDLGCAPGSWIQAVKKIQNNKGQIIGIDIVPMKPILGAEFILGDITKKGTLKKMKHKFDVVLSDMAPKTSGKIQLDVELSLKLSEMAFNVAKKYLKVKGNFLCKVFQGKGYQSFFNDIKSHFEFCKTYVPKATRKNSKEVYIVAKGFKRRKLFLK